MEEFITNSKDGKNEFMNTLFIYLFKLFCHEAFPTSQPIGQSENKTIGWVLRIKQK